MDYVLAIKFEVGGGAKALLISILIYVLTKCCNLLECLHCTIVMFQMEWQALRMLMHTELGKDRQVVE